MSNNQSQSLYYITRKDSETGKKFEDFKAKMDLVHNDTVTLAKELGLKGWRKHYFSVTGGMSSCVFPEGVTPDRQIWKKNKDGEYFPRSQSKIFQRISNLPTLYYKELNNCIGFESCTEGIGFNYNHNAYFGFVFDTEWECNIPSDCEEVTYTKYKKLFNIDNQ